MEGGGNAIHAVGSAPPPSVRLPGASPAPRLVSFPSPPRARTLAVAQEDGAVVPGAARPICEDEIELHVSAFGPAPSQEEVARAIATIRQVFSPATFSRIFEEESSSISSKDDVVKSPTANGKMHKISSNISKSGSIEPMKELCNKKSVESLKVIEAFRSLHKNPSIQRMVTSLSSDKAVWDAVMKNAAVKELRDSFYGVSRTKMKQVGCSSNTVFEATIVEAILDWVLDLAKGKIAEILEKIWKIANDIFVHRDDVAATVVADAVRSSFMLSVVVFMVVVVCRLSVIH